MYFRFANFEGDLSRRINSAKTGSGLHEYVTAMFDASLTWDDVKWLKRYSACSRYRLQTFVISTLENQITLCTSKRAKQIRSNQIEICCRTTTLPIILKGILTAEDALLAVENGVDGIIVSNHGARQIDSVPATVGLFFS